MLARKATILSLALSTLAFGAAAADFDAGAAAQDAAGALAKAVTITPGASSYDACAKAENGQLRLADERGCNASELPVSLRAGSVAPLEVSRVLSIPAGAGGIYGGIFGGLQCPAGRTQVSGGFQLMRSDVSIRESMIAPGFGLPRVYIVNVGTSGTVLPEGDVVKMWATCL